LVLPSTLLAEETKTGVPTTTGRTQINNCSIRDDNGRYILSYWEFGKKKERTKALKCERSSYSTCPPSNWKSLAHGAYKQWQFPRERFHAFIVHEYCHRHQNPRLPPHRSRLPSHLNGDRQRHTEQRALDVTQHIVVALVGMTKRTIPRPSRRHETIQRRLHVDEHVGSAFSLIVNEAEVCWRNKWQSPIRIWERSGCIFLTISCVIK
jgi:hypothetical protein